MKNLFMKKLKDLEDIASMLPLRLENKYMKQPNWGFRLQAESKYLTWLPWCIYRWIQLTWNKIRKLSYVKLVTKIFLLSSPIIKIFEYRRSHKNMRHLVLTPLIYIRLCQLYKVVNPSMPGGNKKATHT